MWWGSAGWVLKQVHVPLGGSSARSVLVVGLLLARAGDGVLGLGGARAEAVQSPTILCVVDVVFEEKLQTKYKVTDMPQTLSQVCKQECCLIKTCLICIRFPLV